MVECSDQWRPKVSREDGKLRVRLCWTMFPASKAHDIPPTHGFLYMQTFENIIIGYSNYNGTDCRQASKAAGGRAGRQAMDDNEARQ